MKRHLERIASPAIGKDVQVLAFGHYGAPMIAFPSGGGAYHDFEDNGMIGVLAPWIEAGKLKVYCPESLDNESWLAEHKDPHWRAVRHNDYQAFIVHDLVPAIRHDCQQSDINIGLMGCSLGGFHTANFALKFPHIFHYGLAMSGRYNTEAFGGGPSGSEEIYFNNPMAYVHNLGGDALEHVRRYTHLTLVCGQGAWEDQCLSETRALASLLYQKHISCECNIWGHDVEHHWYWWRKQVAHHMAKVFA